jgi:hypothetical protein
MGRPIREHRTRCEEPGTPQSQRQLQAFLIPYLDATDGLDFVSRVRRASLNVHHLATQSPASILPGVVLGLSKPCLRSDLELVLPRELVQARGPRTWCPPQ